MQKEKPMSLKELMKLRRAQVKKKQPVAKPQEKEESAFAPPDEEFIVVKAQSHAGAAAESQRRQLLDITKVDPAPFFSKLNMASSLEGFCCIPQKLQGLLGQESKLFENLSEGTPESLGAALATMKEIHAYLQQPLFNLKQPINLFKEKRFEERKRALVSQLEASSKMKSSEVQLPLVQIVEHRTMPMHTQDELTDFDEVMGQDIFMTLEASPEPDREDYQLVFSALLQNILKCEDSLPVVRVTEATIDQVQQILEYSYYLGGFPKIAVKFDQLPQSCAAKRKRVGNMAQVLQLAGNKARNSRVLQNLFHFMAAQTQELPDFDYLMGLLTSTESVAKHGCVGQIASTGLCPFEQAVQSHNWRFLDYLVKCESIDQRTVLPSLSHNLLSLLGNLMSTQFDLFQRAILEYIFPYLRNASKQEEHLQELIRGLKSNISPTQALKTKKVLRLPFSEAGAARGAGEVAQQGYQHQRSTLETESEQRIRSKFAAINQGCLRAAVDQLPPADQVCFWLLIQPQLRFGALVPEMDSSASEFAGSPVFELIREHLIIPVEEDQKGVIFGGFEFPFHQKPQQPTNEWNYEAHQKSAPPYVFDDTLGKFLRHETQGWASRQDSYEYIYGAKHTLLKISNLLSNGDYRAAIPRLEVAIAKFSA